MRLMLFLLIVGGVCVWWGSQNTYIALRDRHQLEISCADYVTKRPEARWLKLTGCEYDFDHMAYEQSQSGTISKVYLPLRPTGEQSGPTRIVVVRDDEEMVKVANALEHDDAKPEPAFDHVMQQLAQPTEGLVQFGLDLNDKDKKDLAGLGLGLDRDFVLIDNGAKPKLMKGLGVLSLGLTLLGVFGVLIARRFRKPKVVPAAKQGISQFERPV